MVAGLEDANEGNILINNKKVNELEPMERNIAMVFKIMHFILTCPYLITWLTV